MVEVGVRVEKRTGQLLEYQGWTTSAAAWRAAVLWRGGELGWLREGGAKWRYVAGRLVSGREVGGLRDAH